MENTNYSALIYCNLFEMAQMIYVVNEDTSVIEEICPIDGYESVVDFCFSKGIHKLTLMGLKDFITVKKAEFTQQSKTKYSDFNLEIEVQDINE